MTADTDSSLNRTGAWTYVPQAIINDVDPANGTIGYRVTVTGTGLLMGGTSIASATLAGVPVRSVLSASNTQVVVVAGNQLNPTAAGPTRLVNNVGAFVVRNDTFAFRNASRITDISPSAGVGGTIVTITGDNLLSYDDTGLSNVTLAGLNVRRIVSANNSMVIVVAEASDAAVVGNVQLIANAGGEATATNAFTYVAPPTISTVVPNSGITGSEIYIAGINLWGGGTAVASVTLAGVEVQSIEVDTNALVAVYAGAHPSVSQVIKGDIVIVSNTGATITATNAFTYIREGNITTVDPASGQVGTRVTITGENLQGNAGTIQRVTLNGVLAAINLQNETVVVVTAGDAFPGTGDIVFQIDDNAVVMKLNGFTYLEEGSIYSVSPSSGQFGTVITLTGNNMLGGGNALAQARLGAANAHRIVSATNSEIVLVAPNASASAKLEVRLVADTGAIVTRSAAWQFLEPGVISNISPASGQHGTTVTITGERLLGGGSAVTNLTVGEFDALQILAANATVVIARMGDNGGNASSAALDVLLISNTSAQVLASAGLRYHAVGTIDQVQPAAAPGGTRITLTGQRLLGFGAALAQASVGAVRALAVEQFNATRVVLRTGVPPALGPADIDLLADNGAIIGLANGFEFTAPGNITSVSPSSGQGGTSITVTGTSLLGGGATIASASVAGIAAAVIQGNDTYVVLEVGLSTQPQNGVVQLVADTGAITSRAAAFNYLVPPNITSVTPSTGQVGTRVTIEGQGLLAGGSVVQTAQLAGVPVAAVQSSNNSYVVLVAADSSPLVGNVTLEADTGATVASANDAWTYAAKGSISGISPAAGQVGTFVTISGTNLRGYGSAVTTVRLGSVQAAIQSHTNAQVVVRAGADSVDAVNLTVVLVADTGAIITRTDLWEYKTLGNITQVSPASGQAGTRVTISGTGLLGGGTGVTSVSLNGVAATAIVSANQTDIVVVAGARASAGTGDVEVVANDGTQLVSSNAFAYLARGAVTTVAPVRGQLGTVVTITGTNLLQGASAVTAVQLAGVEVESVISANDTIIVVVADAATAATEDVVSIVADTGASVASTGNFTYDVPSAITAVSPASGQAGTRVTVQGTNLFGASNGNAISAARLDNQPATIVSANNTYVVVNAPNLPVTTTATVTLEADSGARTVRNAAFTYIELGNITEFTPAQGQYGMRITISGTNLLGGGTAVQQVRVANVPVLSVILANSTQIVVRLAPSTPKTQPAVVTSDTGAVVTGAAQFTYVTASAITTVSPSSGQSGVLVTIAGTNLLAGGTAIVSVSLAGVAATVVSANNTQVVVNAGTASNVTGDVVIEADNGALASKTNGFAYQPAGVVASTSPTSGQVGTRVTVAGSNLRGSGSAVVQGFLGNVAAEVVSESSSQVVLRAGAGPVTQTTVNVRLVADDGSVVIGTNVWTYEVPGSIVAIGPASGQTGTIISISGTKLCGAGGSAVAAVTIGGVSATIDSQTNCALLTVVAGTRTVNESTPSDVVLQGNTGALVTETNGFAYTPAGVITSVSPSAGQGTNTVTIVGTSLLGGDTALDTVQLADVQASIISANSTQVVVAAGAGPKTSNARTGDVVLTNTNGVSITLVDGWAYTVIDAITPGSGQGGTLVTITGSSLLGGGTSLTLVRLAGQTVQSIVEANSTRVVVVAAARANNLDITGQAVLTTNQGQVLRSVSGLLGENEKEFTYKPPGSIASVTPTSGQGSTLVTITGTQLLGYGSQLANATLAGVPVAEIVSANATQVVVVAAGAAGASSSAGAVELTANTGAVVSAAATWSYVAPGGITTVSPTSGQAGTRVTLTGTGLLSGATDLAQVTLAGVAVRAITSANDTVIVVEAGARAGAITGNVEVVSSNGGTVTKANGWQYLQAGSITTVTPASGQAGTQVTLTGERFLGGGSSVVSVKLNGVEAATIVQANATYIELVAAAGTGAGTVLVTADTGAEVVRATAWTYLVAGNITSVTPSSGQLNTRVTIAGTNLLGGGSDLVSVTLGGRAVKSIVSKSNSQVVVVVDSGTAGQGNVVLVSDTAATVTLANGWTQLTDGTVASVTPSSGQTNTRVTIAGQRLLGGATDLASVTLAGVAAAYVANSGSNTQVVVVAQSGGTVGASGSVVLTASTGATVTAASAFTYVAAGNITEVTPVSGQNGTLVNISGTNLLAGGSEIVDVIFGGVSVREVISSSNSLVSVVIDGSTSAGVVDVTLVADTGATTVAEDSFTYLAQSLFASVSPASGQQGTRVTINGLRLLGGGTAITSVKLNGVEVQSIVSSSDLVVTVVAGAGSAGTGNILLTSDTGSQLEADGWTYLTAGVIDSVSPSSGQLGSRVTLTGSRLLGGGTSVTSVRLGAVAVESVVSANNTQIVVVAARNGAAANNVDVVVQSNTGATVTKTGAWSYLAPGAIATVSPASGQRGTRVVIQGTNLLGDGTSAASVTLAGVAATVVASSQTSVNVTAQSATAEALGDVVIVSDTGVRVVSTNGFRHFPDGYIDFVTTASGPAGTQVSIFGSQLRARGARVEAATLAGSPSNILFESNSLVLAQVGEASNPAGDVVLISNTGSTITLEDGWTFTLAANVTSISPSSGTLGTVVTIAGTGLLSGGSSLLTASLADATATIVFQNDTLVILKAGYEVSTTGSLRLVANNGVVATKANAFTYLPLGSIHKIEPESGQLGTRVTITGEFMLGGAPGVDSVSLAGVAVDTVVSATESKIVVVAGALNISKQGNFVITSSHGSSLTRTNGWSYVSPAQISAVSPNQGQVGTVVEITGTGLLMGGTQVADVKLAGKSVGQVLSSNNTLVRVVAAVNGSAPTGPVMLVADTGAYTSGAGWQYLEESVIDAISPATGQGGTVVTVTGERLRGGGTAVVSATLAGVAATVVRENATSVTLVAGASASAGTGHVVLQSDTGATSTLAGGWTYSAAGQVTEVTPASGQAGTLVTICGTRLLGGGSAVVQVKLHTVIATVVRGNDTEVVVKAGASSGAVQAADVTVVSDTDSQVVAAGAWAYLVPGIIASLAPASGQFGTVVTVTGTNLLGGGSSLAEVTVIGVPAAQVLSQSNTQVVIKVDNSTAATGAVVLVADTGAAVQSGAASWTYVATTLPIANRDDLVQVVAGASAQAGQGHVVVTADTGATATLVNGWTYVPQPQVSSISPASGQIGTRVSIFGTSLLGGASGISAVSLADVPVQDILFASDTRIEVRAARGSAGYGQVNIVANTGAVVQTPALNCTGN